MKALIFATLVACGLALSGQAAAQADLAKSAGCMNCHDAATKKVGPSFKDIAAKYKGKADAPAMLAAKVSGGKDHPQVKASPEDVTKLVNWILGM
jgi:cytochrome c